MALSSVIEHHLEVASPTRLVLIRHGESRAQVAGVVSGHHTCSGLSERGLEQAGLLSEHFARSGELADVEVIFTSLLPRAQQTAAAISEAVGAPTARPECAWCEIQPGAAEGLTWDEMRARYPPIGDPDDPVARRLPEMETWAEMYARVGRRLHEVSRQHAGETVVIVTSGGPIGASFVTLGGSTMHEGITLTRATTNTSVTEWQFDGRRWRLQRHNDAPHLGSAHGIDWGGRGSRRGWR